MAVDKKERKKEEVLRKYTLKRPHISEKATDLEGEGFYTFKVEKGANKKEIKEEIEREYKVDVLSVRTVTIPSKKRRVGKTEGTKKGYKKAIVKLKKGQNIDLTSA